jgi:hypothetical protein
MGETKQMPGIAAVSARRRLDGAVLSVAFVFVILGVGCLLAALNYRIVQLQRHLEVSNPASGADRVLMTLGFSLLLVAIVLAGILDFTSWVR